MAGLKAVHEAGAVHNTATTAATLSARANSNAEGIKAHAEGNRVTISGVASGRELQVTHEGPFKAAVAVYAPGTNRPVVWNTQEGFDARGLAHIFQQEALKDPTVAGKFNIDVTGPANGSSTGDWTLTFVPTNR